MPDTDNDEIIDGQDGWPICKELAPRRLPRPKYAVIRIKELGSNQTLRQFDINNNAHAILKVGNNSDYYKADATGNRLIELPSSYLNSWGWTEYYTYKSLNEANYFVQGAEAIYRNGELVNILEKPTPADLGLTQIAPSDFRNYEASVVFNDGAVVGSADVSLGYVGGSGTHLDAEADLLWDVKGDFTILNEALHSEQDEFVTGTFNGNNIYGFVTTYSNSPSFSIKDPYWGDDPYVFPTTAVNAGSLMEIKNGNSQEVAVGYQYTISDDYWVAPVDSRWLDYYWDGEITQDIGIWLKKENKFQVLHSPQCFNDYNTYGYPSYEPSTIHLSNKNTVIVATEEEREVTNSDGTKETITEQNAYLWLDQTAGLQNDQPVTATPNLKKITWLETWGPAPPVNLNARMQGFESNGSKIWHNRQWLDIADIIPATEWTNIQIKDINDHGMLAAQATDAEGTKCAVFLVPVDIVPDYNRDGKIDEEDRGKVTKENPWRWWINDDNDLTVEERSGNLKDVPKQDSSVRDCNDLKVDGIRDLIDFFPLHLDLKQALEVLPADKYMYVLKHEDEALKFFDFPTAILDGSEPARAPNWHITQVSAGRGLKQYELKLASVQGAELSSDLLGKFKEGKGLICIEGAKKTEKPLVLEIFKKSDNSSIAKIKFPIRIKDVEDMYRHVNMRASGGNTTQKNEPSAYPDDLTNGKYVAYIHGFNVSGESARGSQSNIYKRLHHLGNKARFIGVSWDGNPDNPLGLQAPAPDYHAAVFNGLIGGLPLKNHLAFAGGANLTILAHSLGNSIAGSAIALHGLDVSHYYIINGAIPLQAYDEDQTDNSNKHPDMKRSMTEDDWKPYYDFGRGERLLAANWHDLFKETPLDNRNKLTWNNLFKKPELLAVTYNFYSSSDEVVENADEHNEEFFANIVNAVWTWDFSRHAWVQQEIGKGGQSLIAHTAFRDINAGWKFNFRTHDGEVGVSEWEYGYYLEYLFSGSTLHRKYKPDEADSQISDADLREKPFYKPFPYLDLYDSDKGSAIAGETINRYKLLATGIPATSYAIAANSSRAINPSRNFNMSAEMKSPTGSSSWPADSSQENPEDWLHSDFKDVALHFVHPMYRKMIGLAELDKK